MRPAFLIVSGNLFQRVGTEFRNGIYPECSFFVLSANPEMLIVSNSNAKTLILKDSSVRSIWTYLTASPWYTTNTNKHDNTTNKYYKDDHAIN